MSEYVRYSDFALFRNLMIERLWRLEKRLDGLRDTVRALEIQLNALEQQVSKLLDEGREK